MVIPQIRQSRAYNFRFTMAGNNYEVDIDIQKVSSPSSLRSVLVCGPGITLPKEFDQPFAGKSFHIVDGPPSPIIDPTASVRVPISEASSMAFALSATRSIPPEVEIGGAVWLCFRLSLELEEDGEFKVYVQDSRRASISDCDPSRIEQLRQILSNVPFPSRVI